MSRKSTRYDVANYITAANILGVGKVFPSPPKYSSAEQAFVNVPAGTPSGSVIYVEILRTHEVRVALGGATGGQKALTHSLRLHVLFRSVQRRAEDAMDDHDDLIEAILELLRLNRTLNSSTLLQNGEGEAGITVEVGVPVVTGVGVTSIWSAIDTEALEIITA